MSLDRDKPSGYRSFNMTEKPAHVWHPWLRIERVLCAILTERWSAEAWRRLRPEVPTVLAERSRIRRAGWFN